MLSRNRKIKGNKTCKFSYNPRKPAGLYIHHFYNTLSTSSFDKDSKNNSKISSLSACGFSLRRSLINTTFSCFYSRKSAIKSRERPFFRLARTCSILLNHFPSAFPSALPSAFASNNSSHILIYFTPTS